MIGATCCEIEEKAAKLNIQQGHFEYVFPLINFVHFVILFLFTCLYLRLVLVSTDVDLVLFV